MVNQTGFVYVSVYKVTVVFYLLNIYRQAKTTKRKPKHDKKKKGYQRMWQNPVPMSSI